MVLILQLGCNERNRHVQSTKELSQDSILLISKMWKADSSGCSRLRDPRKIVRLMEQTKLIGKDSTLIKDYLGEPNRIAIFNGHKTYTYWLECVGEKKISYSNFYCDFRGDTLNSYHHSIY
jgi:hypothetical protein